MNKMLPFLDRLGVLCIRPVLNSLSLAYYVGSNQITGREILLIMINRCSLYFCKWYTFADLPVTTIRSLDACMGNTA